jgi:DNA-binding NarL/FixJ family response regulator
MYTYTSYIGNTFWGVAETNNCYYLSKEKTSVLAVDDDHQVGRLIKRYLDSDLYTVIYSNGIADTLSIFKDMTPDWVLIDLHLTYSIGNSDTYMLQKLRCNGFCNPIIVMSADDTFESVHEAVKHGASGYLVKNDSDNFLGQFEYLMNNISKPESEKRMPPAAIAYLRTRGLTDWDIQLVRIFANTFDREKEISYALNRKSSAVRKQFQLIRNKLGARNQADLGRMLGVISCFT